ncbi:FecR family protein [Sphingomonas sp. OTU376]|uniref:FecR family protein n=1 Tax=Sphingomonas sp. OTU376 TaxID=3043863 RepID=UPI00313B6908
MHDRETAETIDDAASEWAARIDRGLSEPEQQALDAWLAVDTRRIGALARARALWVHAEQAVARGPVPAEVEPRKGLLNRRRLLAGGATALAATLAGVLVVPRLLGDSGELASGIGETRRVTLEDGSAVTLGPGTRLRRSFDTARRLIELVSGEAFFEVAQDARRPFVVLAGQMTLRALESAFGVRAIEGVPLAVIVSTGKVRVGAGGVERVLESNMRLDASAPGATARVTRLEPDALQRSLAWREGILAFEGDMLASVAKQFDRYGAVRIVIADPVLAREPITGSFAANDPRGFARAIAASLGARVAIEGDTIRLSRQPPAK